MYTDFHVWEINVSTTLLSIPNNRIYICYALSFQKHVLIICASERSERALRIIVYFHFSETYLRMSQVMYDLSANIHFIEQYRDHLQVYLKAKISLCGHCLMNYFGISLLSLILTFSSTFLSLSLSRYCGSHVSITTLTIAFIDAK